MESAEFAHSGPESLQRMNRDEVAQFLVSRSDDIRALLGRRGAKPVPGFGTSDVVSSVIRRVDAAVERGTFVPQNPGHVWAYASTAARLLSISKASMAGRFRSLDDGDTGWREDMLASIEKLDEASAADILFACAATLDEREERTFFLLLMRGASIATASEALGWKPDNGRRRWAVIKTKLRERFSARYGPHAT